MLDLMSTLDPAHGVAHGWEIRAPRSEGLPLWRLAVDIGGLSARGASLDEYPAHTVGAYGTTRQDTLTRGVGEAVERAALFPAPGYRPEIETTAEDLAGTGLDFASHHLGEPSAMTTPLPWYRGRWLDTDESVLVPAPLVDYPVEHPSFDPTPSGTAAGPNLEFAVRAALGEVIERDAALVAWSSADELVEFDVEAELALAPGGPQWRALAKLLAAARGLGLVPRLFRLPTLPELVGVLGVVVDGRSLTAVGAKAGPDLGRALLVALQEALQVRDALTTLRDHWRPSGTVDEVRDDMDRARLWLTPAATERMTDRVRRVSRAVPGETAARTARTSLPALCTAVRAEGGRPLVVDLSERLPDALRAMGWRVVKVVVAGFQTLRMDESRQFTWHPGRLGPAPSRFPHPLI